MKVTLAVLATPVVGVAAIAGWVGISVSQHLHKSYEIQPVSFASDIKGDPALGEHIVTVRNGCVECHGRDLSGDKVMDNPAMGKVYAPNLTPAALKDWSDGEIARAIRHGIGKRNQPLVIMPSEDYIHFSQQDLANIVAYLRSVAPVDKPRTEIRLGPVSSVLLATGKAPLLSAEVVNHEQPFSKYLPAGETVEFGEYLAKTACMGCHKSSLKGGKIDAGPPDWPPAADLTQAALGSWKQADFIKALRSGVNPQGKALAAPMPIKMTARFSDMELKALWKYLQTVKG
ncbi:MAG: cytochrome c [Candidatus Sericytochromatia bacterium]